MRELVGERGNEGAQHCALAKRAEWSEGMRERCNRVSDHAFKQADSQVVQYSTRQFLIKCSQSAPPWEMNT